MPTDDRTDRLFETLAAALPGGVTFDAAFGANTTYRVGGRARYVVVASRAADIPLIAQTIGESGVPVLVVGNGSNLLVSDAGFDGVVVRCAGELVAVEFDDLTLTAGGGMSLPSLARQAVAQGRRGLEFLVGIPGTVGGAVRQNAGGHGRETVEVLVCAQVVNLRDGSSSERQNEWFDFGYRRSRLASEDMVVAATFTAPPGDREHSAELLDEIVKWRRANQPGGANAGSVFVNPPEQSAGSLIDQAGLKGLRRGGAFVSPKHANFIQAESGATAGDVLAVMHAVAAAVEERFGIALKPETQLVGFTENERSPW